MIWFRRCDSRLTICTSFLSSSSSGAKRASSLSAPVMAVSGWRISWAMAAERRPSAAMRSLVDDFAFQALQFGEVLEIEDVAAGFILSGAQRRNRKAQKARRSGRRAKFDLLAQRQGISLLVDFHRPETGKNVGNVLAAQQTESVAGDLRAGAIHQQDAASRSVVSKPPRMDSMMS